MKATLKEIRDLITEMASSGYPMYVDKSDPKWEDAVLKSPVHNGFAEWQGSLYALDTDTDVSGDDGDLLVWKPARNNWVLAHSIKPNTPVFKVLVRTIKNVPGDR